MKMKNKKLIAVFACILIVIFVLGAANALQFAKPSANEKSESRRLIGMLITTDYLDLFDMDRFLNDHGSQLLNGQNISMQQSSEYKDRIYASLTDEFLRNEQGEPHTLKKYVFDEIDGIAFFCPEYTDESGAIYQGSEADDAITDVSLAITSADEEEGLSMEGTIYVSTLNGPTRFYFNPVYQNDAGDVYVETGNGTSHSGDIVAGMSSAHRLNEETSVTINGKKKTVRTDIAVTVCYMDAPDTVSVLQMDQESKIIQQDKFESGEFPQELKPNAQTAYFIVETHQANTDTVLSRELFTISDDDNYLTAFSARSDGICIKQYCTIS